MKPQPILTFSFDDCYRETIRIALPILQKKGFRGTFNFIPGLLGQRSEGMYLASLKELKQLDKSGMEIACHSLNHQKLAKSNRIKKYFISFFDKQNKIKHFFYSLKSKQVSQTPSKPISLHKEIISSYYLLKQTGIEAASFVYPFGFYNKRVKGIVKRKYFSARSADWGLNQLPPKDPFALKVFIWDKWTKPEKANQWVERAIKKNAWLIEVFHLVADKNETDYEYFTQTSDMKKHLEFVKKTKIWVATQKDVINYLNNGKKKRTIPH